MRGDELVCVTHPRRRATILPSPHAHRPQGCPIAVPRSLAVAFAFGSALATRRRRLRVELKGRNRVSGVSLADGRHLARQRLSAIRTRLTHQPRQAGSAAECVAAAKAHRPRRVHADDVSKSGWRAASSPAIAPDCAASTADCVESASSVERLQRLALGQRHAVLSEKVFHRKPDTTSVQKHQFQAPNRQIHFMIYESISNFEFEPNSALPSS